MVHLNSMHYGHQREEKVSALDFESKVCILFQSRQRKSFSCGQPKEEMAVHVFLKKRKHNLTGVIYIILLITSTDVYRKTCLKMLKKNSFAKSKLRVYNTNCPIFFILSI